MTVERTTPQLVKKGKGKKRPGYRGDAAYGRSSRSSQATSIGQARGATGKGGGASLGGGRDRNEQPAQQFIGGKSYNVTPETRGDRDRAQLKQQIMNQTKLGGNRIDKFGNTKKNLFRGGGGGIGSLLASLFGMAMGIPGLGLLTGGFGKIKEGLGSLGNTLGDFRENFTGFKTQAEYDQAMFDRRQQKRLDKLFTAKDRGYNQIGFGDFTKKTMDFTPGQQAKIDDLLAQGYTPSTARNVLTGRDLKGFTPSRMGLQTMTPMAKPTFSDPFANTVGTTTKVNAPSNDAVSSVTPDYSGIQDYGVDINVSNNPNSFSKNLATHLDNNAKFAAARDAGLISDKDYNTLGGFDVTQQLAGGNPVVGGLLNMFGSPVYNTLQGFMDTAGQPRKDIADMNEDGSVSFTSTPTSSQQLGAIPGTVTRNTLGGFGLMSPELKTTYYDILNPQDFADGGIASMFTRRGIVAQITDQKFKELYEQFQIEKNNLGSDSQFAEFLNKKNINPGVLNKKAGGSRTGVKNETFNEKTVSGRRQRLKIKPPKNTLVGRAAENRNKVDKLLRKEITKANNKDKFITSNKISFIVEDKLNFKPRLDKGKRVPRFNAAKAGQKAYPILSELDSRADKVDKVLRDLLIDEKPLEDRLVQVIKKKTNVGDNRTTLKILRATPTFAAIAEDGAELLIQAPTMLDYKGQNLTDQLDTALNKQLAQPVYTGLGGVRSRFYSPAYVTMKFAIENWNRNKGQGPVEFFDKKGNRINWERGAKLPIRNVSFKYNNKTHKYNDLNKKAYIEKNFPEVYKKTIAANALKAKKIDNPFEPGKKITVKDLVKKIQVDGYKWSPRFATLDILHGPKGIKGEPFTNLRYNTKDINHLEAGLSQNVQSGKLSKSEYNQSVKEINKTFKGLQGTDYDQAIIDRVTTQAEKIKKGTFYGFDQFKNIIRQNIISRATNNDNNICEVVFGAKRLANGGSAGGGCAKQMELEFDKAPEQTLNKIAQSSDSTLKGFAQRSLSLFPKLGTVGKIATVAAGAGIALSGLRFNPEKGEIVTTDNDQKADQNQILQYVKDNPLKVTAGTSLGFAAQEVPGAYKAARDLGRGRVRSTLGISGAIRPVLTTFGTPLITGLYEGAIGAKRLDEGETMTDILTDPVGPALGLTLMEPLSKLSGVVRDAPKRTMLEGAKNYFNLSNVGQARPGLTGQILRMGLSPRMIAGASRFLGLPGIALGAGLAGYDAYKNYQNQEGMIYNLFNKDG